MTSEELQELAQNDFDQMINMGLKPADIGEYLVYLQALVFLNGAQANKTIEDLAKAHGEMLTEFVNEFNRERNAQ